MGKNGTIKVLSLFDGMGCGREALKRVGIEVESYHASEVDKYAISVSQAMNPDNIQIGDVLNVDFKKYKADIVIGGSPCTDLSIAKKNRQGLEGEKSKLFWEYIKALKTILPKYFLLENVASMSKESKEVITETLKAIYPDVRCYLIDSALVSAQRRRRLYWTNIPGVLQPKDKKIYLKDIIESGITYQDKTYCIDVCYYKGSSLEHTLNKSNRLTQW